MPLQSRTFTDRPQQVKDRLEKCSQSDSFHIYEQMDPVGEHVSAIQEALRLAFGIDVISVPELLGRQYGPATQQAVVAFKSEGSVNGTGKAILRYGQTKPDHIVGIQTIAALDRVAKMKEKPLPQPAPPQPAPEAPAGAFSFPAVKVPLLIKLGKDDPMREDLENAPVTRTGTAEKARGMFFPNVANEQNCKASLLAVTGHGGPEAREFAEFFLRNQRKPPDFFRDFVGDHFWVNQVRKHKSFVENHAKLAAALHAGLQQLANKAKGLPRVVDANKLEEGNPEQPDIFARFGNNINFSQGALAAAFSPDPLAFAIGSIQGLEVRITEFAGQPDGNYKGKLQYVIIDHYGSNDSDLNDLEKGQAGLWLLQRKMAAGQSKTGFEPYRVRITVDNMEFSNRVLRPLR